MPDRLKAFLLHLTISILIALLALLIVFRLWYPAPLHEALGVTHIFLLLLLVDVTLGPLMTLLVYKAGKRTLTMDLTIIAALQLTALGYGFWNVVEGRPAWIVYNADRFDVVTVVDIDTRSLEDAPTQYRNAPWTGPQWVAAVGPANLDEYQGLLFESIMGGSDLPQRPNLYRPLEEMAEAMQQHARPLTALNSFNDPAIVQTTLQKWPTATAWLPLMARIRPMAVLLSEDNRVIAIVELNPWE